MKEKALLRPTKDMTRTAIPRDQLLALLQGDDAMRTLVQTIVQEVLEAEMEEAPDAAFRLASSNGRTCSAPTAVRWSSSA